MRDGIEAARRGLAAVSLVTEVFWDQGDFVARSFGMPDIPRTRLPHPVAGTGTDRMAAIADEVAGDVVARLGLVPS